MKTICNRKECTGCGACQNICTHDAIEMKADWCGFLRPEINHGKCVNCGLCHKVCPANNSVASFEFDKAIAFIDNNELYLKRASSGGAFGAIARYVIENKGIVFGASMDDDYNVVYKGVETVDDLVLLHGSKYVQAYTGSVYKQVKSELNSGRYVLFCGCPCQVAGLHLFLRKDYERLITMDLICHGVPSQPYFKDYVHDLLRRKKSSGITTFRFRNISETCCETRHDPLHRKVHVGFHNKDYFMTYFLWGKGYRDSCYRCKYAGGERQGDFTIGDFWNNDVAKVFKDVSDGASLILLNTPKAESLRHVFEENGRTHDIGSLEKAIGGTGGQLKHPCKYDIRCKLIYVLYKLFGLYGPKFLFKIDNMRMHGK